MHGTIIYIKLNNGTLEYRDSEGHSGDTITTHAKHNGKIVWKLDQCSGISEITGIQLQGNLNILNGKPRKVDFNQWEVRASDQGEGEVSYTVEVVKCEKAIDETVTTQGLKDPKPPILRVP